MSEEKQELQALQDKEVKLDHRVHKVHKGRQAFGENKDKGVCPESRDRLEPLVHPDLVVNQGLTGSQEVQELREHPEVWAVLEPQVLLAYRVHVVIWDNPVLRVNVENKVLKEIPEQLETQDK